MKRSIDDIREMFFIEKYVLITTEYHKNTQKMEFVCNNGHYSSITLKQWLSGKRCKYCYWCTPIIQGKKKCNICKEGKSIKKFKRRKSNVDYFGFSYSCVDCIPEIKNKKIPKGKKELIIKRYDEKIINDYIPKNAGLKLLVVCQECRNKYTTNAYRIYENSKFLCRSCCAKKAWETPDKRKKMLQNRNINEYKERMSEINKKLGKSKEYREKMKKISIDYHSKKRGFGTEFLDDFYIYKKRAQIYTEREYKKNKHIINPNSLPRGRGKDKYHVDHVFSIMEGFKNNIPVYIISNFTNLQMLREKDNLIKDCKSDVSKKELYKKGKDSI